MEADKRSLHTYNRELEKYKADIKHKKSTGQPPQKPILRQLLTDKSSLLALGKTAEQNNTGVFFYSTEFGETLSELHKLKQAEKSVIMNSYHKAFFKYCVTNRSTICTDIKSGMYAATTIHKFLDVVRDEDVHDGFMTRTKFSLYFKEDNPPTDLNYCISKESKDFYERLIKNLIGFKWHDNGDGTYSPEYIPWETDAKAAYDAWYAKMDEQRNRGEFKHPERFGRFVGSMTLTVYPQIKFS